MTMTSLARDTARHAHQDVNLGLMGKMKSYLNRSRAERQLRQLDDRMLSDIGLNRGEISKMVWGN
jgi:uncharacterized protein YjiS (DUF1127 family)